MQHKQSSAAYAQAKTVMPGGVNSPVRAFGAVGGEPVFIARAQGAQVTDIDGNVYTDYVASWGPMVLGHTHPDVLKAVQDTAARGFSFGAPCEMETQLATRIIEMVPAIDKLRLVSSGTEACMTAIRLARGYTGKSKLIKFEGCYHGHSDSLLVKAGSGALTHGVPTSKGVTAGTAQDTLIATYNDLSSVEALFTANKNAIAAIIIEPIPGNMSMLLPEPGFLEGLRALCDQYAAVLIFDEVMTGFRLSAQGVQGLVEVHPDLVTLGKIVGGGFPLGAVGGRDEIMSCLAPEGGVYQAGTLSGNPVAVSAGLATLAAISVPGFYDALAARTTQLVTGLESVAKAAGVALQTHHRTGMFGLFFTDRERITRYAEVVATQQDRFVRFFQGMLSRGHYFAPSSFEAGFVSAAHHEADIQATIAAAAEVFETIAAC